ncbi:MAG: branched-chain amino acid aminotransferase [Sphingobacteriales bacterium]|jgi:branched-chain amino acid aminotransferase
MHSKYNESLISIDGKVVSNYESNIPTNNRGLLFGDGLFETIFYLNGKILLFDEHYERLRKGLKLLGGKAPDKESLLIDATILLHKKEAVSAKVKLVFFRKGEGAYSPESNEFTQLIEVAPLKSDGFQPNNTLEAGVYPEPLLVFNSLSAIKRIAAVNYVIANKWVNENNLDLCLLKNAKNQLAEFDHGNLFLVKNGEVFTPPLSSGALPGVTRRFLMELLKNNGLTVVEKAIEESDLKDYDEIWATSSLSGLRSISRIQDWTFNHKVYDTVFPKFVKEIKKQSKKIR